MKTLPELLAQSAALHHHLCPRQVLGVRMGVLADHLLGQITASNPWRGRISHPHPRKPCPILNLC